MAVKTKSYTLAVMGLLAAAAAALPATRSAGAHENKVSIRADGDMRIIRSNGIPQHDVGAFPNRGNPNAIVPQSHAYRVPMNPVAANRPVPMRRGMSFGVALNGVPFDPGTAEYWQNDRRSGWRYEALSGKINLGLDQNNAHVQPNGAYHYHGLPKGMLTSLSPDAHSPLIGYAADGFPIYALYGYSDPKDPSNARFTVTPEYPDGIFAYFLTEGFPFVPRSFVGTPDSSFRKGTPGGGRHGGRPRIHYQGPGHLGPRGGRHGHD